MGTQNNTVICSKLENYLVYQLLKNPDVEISKQSVYHYGLFCANSFLKIVEGRFLILTIVVLQIKL